MAPSGHASGNAARQGSLFNLLSGGVEVLIRNANPWWRGEELSDVPPFRRWAFEPVMESLRKGLSPGTVLRGPRQIGKTTLLNQIITALLADGVAPNRIFRLQFDDLPDLRKPSMPLIELLDWYSKNILLCDHTLRAAWLQENIPLAPERLQAAPHLADLAGRVAESSVGYFLRSIVGLDVAHFPERGAEPEVDFVLTVGEQRIPLEVKFRRRVEFDDTHGLRSFIEKAHYHAPFGVLVTQSDAIPVQDPRIVCLPLSTLLLMR